MPAIIGYGAKNNLGHRANRRAALVDHHISRLHQIRVDVAHVGNHRLAFHGFVVGQRHYSGLVRTKAGDDAMHRRPARRVVGPLKRAVRKLDVHPRLQHPAPQRCHLLALRDAVGGDKTAAHFAPRQGLGPVHVGKQVAKSSLSTAKFHVLELLSVAAGSSSNAGKAVGGGRDVARRLDIPTRHIVQHPGAFHPCAHRFHVFFLLVGLVLLADKRRVAQNEIELGRRHEVGPVNAQGVAVADVGAALERHAQHGFAKLGACLHVHLVVGEPHGNLRHLGREFFVFDAVKLVHIDLEKVKHMADAAAKVASRAHHVELQLAQFAVSHHQKVAAAAGRVKKGEGLQLFVKLKQAGCIAFDLFKIKAQLVQKQRLYQLEDVGLAGVVRAQFAAALGGLRLNNKQKHGAKDGGRDVAPVALAQGDELAAHGGGERRRVNAFFKQTAIDVGEQGKLFGQRALALRRVFVERHEQGVEHRADVGAVLMGVEVNQVVEAVFGLKDAGVIGKQAKQQPHQEHLQMVTAVAVLFQGVVQLTQRVHRHPVDGFFDPDALLAVTGDEIEKPQIFVQLGQRKAVNEVFVKVMQFKVPEVAQQDVARLFVGFEAGEIVLGLIEGFDQILAAAFVLDEQGAFPQQVDVAVFLVYFLDAPLKCGDLAALDAEDLEKLIPEALGIGVFAFDVFPVFGKGTGTVGDFFPVERHVEVWFWIFESYWALARVLYALVATVFIVTTGVSK